MVGEGHYRKWAVVSELLWSCGSLSVKTIVTFFGSLQMTGFWPDGTLIYTQARLRDFRLQFSVKTEHF